MEKKNFFLFPPTYCTDRQTLGFQCLYQSAVRDITVDGLPSSVPCLYNYFECPGPVRCIDRFSSFEVPLGIKSPCTKWELRELKGMRKLEGVWEFVKDWDWDRNGEWGLGQEWGLNWDGRFPLAFV